MRRKPIFLLLGGISLAVALTALISCGPKKPKEPSTITIGAVLPLTGDMGEYGQRVRKGMDIAATEMSGIAGPRVKLIVEDSEGQTARAIAATNKLIQTDQAKFIVGEVSSSLTLSMLPITDQHGVLLFSPAASAPNLSGASSLFVRNWPSDVLEAAVIATYARRDMNIRSVVTVCVNNDYGIGLQREFERTFRDLKGQTLGSELYALNQRQFRTIVAKYSSMLARIGAFYVAGYHREMASFVKQLRESGYRGQVLAAANFNFPELLELAGSAAEGAVYAVPFYDPKANPVAESFARRFRRVHGSDPSEFEANGYDAVKLIRDGVVKHGMSPDQVAAYIRSQRDYNGAGATLTFTADGNVIKPIAIKTVRGGRFVNLPRNSPMPHTKKPASAEPSAR